LEGRAAEVVGMARERELGREALREPAEEPAGSGVDSVAAVVDSAEESGRVRESARARAGVLVEAADSGTSRRTNRLSGSCER